MTAEPHAATGAGGMLPHPHGAFDANEPPHLEGILDCMHCGICLPQCPTYRVLGQEMDSPRGRVYLIRAVSEGRIGLTENFLLHMDRCLGCRACETACPAGVPFGRLLEETRGQIERLADRPRARRLLGRLVLGVFPDRRRLGRLLGFARVYRRSGLQQVVRGSGLLRPFRRLAAMEGLLPAHDVRPLDPLPRETRPAGTPRGTVALLEGCVQALLVPEVNRATVTLLARAGYRVLVPERQACCGALHLHWGDRNAGRSLARRNVSALLAEADWIVTNAAGCGAAMRDYGHVLPDDPDAATFAARVRDVSELLAEHVPGPRRPLDLTVTYHDPCHLAHGQRVRSEPRELLRRIPGLTLVELGDAELCCGSAGIYNLMEPEIAADLGRRKAERIRETGASIVATGNPGCLMHMARQCRERGVRVELVHPVSLLARSMDAAGRTGGAR